VILAELSVIIHYNIYPSTVEHDKMLALLSAIRYIGKGIDGRRQAHYKYAYAILHGKKVVSGI
jgi:hypothetical protein